MSTIKARIQELKAMGYSDSKIRAFLIIEDYTEAEIKKAMKAKKGMTFADLIEWLGEQPRSESELYEFVLKDCTRNECTWVKDRNKVRLVINSVFEKAGYDVIEEPASDSLVEKVKLKAKGIDPIKQAYEDLQTAIDEFAAGKLTRKQFLSRVHPDKVAQFNDADLTSAYTEAAKQAA